MFPSSKAHQVPWTTARRSDDGMLVPVFEFIGCYQFRFVSSVSRRFRSLYSQFQQKEYRERVPNEQEEFQKLISTSLTSASSIAESLSRAEIFLNDARKLTRPFDPIKIQQNDGTQVMETFCSQEYAVSFLRDSVAVTHGHVDILQFALANGCMYNKLTCFYAAQEGHLHVLQWLRKNDYAWHESTCTAATGGGHVEVLQWARENGCPWDKETCANAATGGHLEVLQWAVENGCTWNQ